MTLAGQKVLIIGGTSGFGFATAVAAANDGAEVVVASSKQKSVDEALARLPNNARGLAINLANESDVEGFFDRVGPIDHLVFTAGDRLSPMPLAEMTLEQAKQLFDVRFWGFFMAAKAGARFIKRGGSITTTCGTVGLRPQKGWVVTAAVVGSVESVTRALAIELAPIRVNAVCAGVVDTNLWS